MLIENRYADLEDILYKGFIPYSVMVRNTHFVFKSVTDVEFDKIVLMSGLKEPKHKYTFNFHINFLYHSIYLINGVNFLKNRNDHYLDFLDIVKKMPSRFVSTVFQKLEDLAERQNLCSKIAEAYFYENTSRYTWLSKKGYLLNDPISTGIEGSEHLGLNQFQKYWSVFNIREDQKERFDENYSLFKFLASFTDSKSVKKIEALDDKKKEEESDRRERIKEYGSDPEEYTKNHLSGPTDTAEQLVASLNRQIKGEKDKHDLAIEQYETKLREDMYKQMQSLKQMRDDRHRNEDYLVEEAHSISQEDMMKRIKRNESKPKFYLSDEDSENRTKYLDMSNVTDKDVISKNNLMSTDDFNNLVKDEMFLGKHNPINDVEEEYLQQQKKLAELGDFSEETNFPNLRGR